MTGMQRKEKKNTKNTKRQNKKKKPDLIGASQLTILIWLAFHVSPAVFT
jgi:hypothetical protein